MDTFLFTTGRWPGFVCHLSECREPDGMDLTEEPVKGGFKAVAPSAASGCDVAAQPQSQSGKSEPFAMSVLQRMIGGREKSVSTLETEGPV